MTKDNEQARTPPPDRFRVEVGYVVNIVGTWDGREAPMTFGLEYPETLVEVEVSSSDLIAGVPMRLDLKTPESLRGGLEDAVEFGVKLAGGLAHGELTIEEMVGRSAYASSDGVELSHEQMFDRLRKIADEVGAIKRAHAN